MNPVHARTANNACASNMPNGRVFIAEDAPHPHLPSIHHAQIPRFSVASTSRANF